MLALALPASAWAQSAGDNQYQDPFANGSPSAGSRGGSGSASQADGSGQTTSGGLQTAGGGSGSSSSTSGATASTAASGELPRTGLDVAPIAALGLTFLLAGLLLRLLSAPRAPRPNGPRYIDLRRSGPRVF